MSIYIFEVPKLHCVKIGFSSTPIGVESRLRTAQTYLPADISLLLELPGSVADERWLHKKLKSAHIRGEWFVRCPEIIKAANLLNGMDVQLKYACDWKTVFKSMKVGAKRWSPHRWERRFKAKVVEHKRGVLSR